MDKITDVSSAVSWPHYAMRVTFGIALGAAAFTMDGKTVVAKGDRASPTFELVGNTYSLPERHPGVKDPGRKLGTITVQTSALLATFDPRTSR